MKRRSLKYFHKKKNLKGSIIPKGFEGLFPYILKTGEAVIPLDKLRGMQDGDKK